MKRLASHSTWWHKSPTVGCAVICRTEVWPAMDHIGVDAGMMNSHICKLLGNVEVAPALDCAPPTFLSSGPSFITAGFNRSLERAAPLHGISL
jgi:hypothetical protein